MDRETLREVTWHHLDPEEAFKRLETDKKGLSGDKARRRLEELGPNKLAAKKRRNPILRFLALFHNILIYILLAAAVVTALLGHWLDTWVILGVVLINTIIGFIQEGKAERALEAIAKMVSLECTVLRDGEEQTIPAEELVPGDIVVLQAGDKVPADLRLFESRELAIDEAVLTGESTPTRKSPESLEADTLLADRDCMAYSSTLVTAGSARGMVIATGNDTEIGRISELVEQTQEVTTPLIRQIAAFGRLLAAVIVGIAVFTFVVGVVFWSEIYTYVEMFLAAVALAVAAIPEGLPAIMTITLALGVQRMAARHAIIRRLPAVDTLGAVTTICSDKTGTLTRNEMMVKLLRTGQDRCMVDGQGYEPKGDIRMTGEKKAFDPERYPNIVECARAGLLCNDARIVRDEDDQLWHVEGDPMEGALVVFARKAGMDDKAERHAWERIDEIPFDSRHKYMATLHQSPDGEKVAYVKGAPEVLLDMCERELHRDEERDLHREDWDGHYEALASAGTRVLLLAKVPMDPGTEKITGDDLKGKAILLGVIGIYDPPREEAIEAVKECKSAGIRVKMLTGDHALTATAIGKQMGIGDGETVMTGKDIETFSDEDLIEAVAKTDVFARVSPEHKLRLVNALQAQGEVVAMTGDGVNDAPALKSADIGIAMGIKGTEVSKEASKMVLTDDNFASIVHAIEEGRTVYTNLRKAILFLLPTNGGQAMTIIAAIMAGMMLPITPVQILWVNMITAVTLAVALAFEPPEPGIMKLPPRDPDQPLLTRFFMWRILFVSVTRTIGTFALFWLVMRQITPDMDEHRIEEITNYARTVAVNTIVIFEVFYLFNVRSIKGSGLNLRTWIGNKFAVIAVIVVVVGQLLFTYVPWLQTLFETAGISLYHWGILTLVTMSSYFIVEGEKWLIRLHDARKPKEERLA